jgi:hypothetical protein
MALMGEKRNAYMVSMGNPTGRNHLEDLGIDERIIRKLIFKK